MTGSLIQANRFEQLYGVDGLIERLKKGVHGGDSVHACLLYGPKGTGKRTLANICARALHCEQGGDSPCDVCGSCRRYLAGTHPDHITVRGEKNIIKVDVIRDLIERLSLRPYEGGRYTVIIERADTMNPQAQNALLKTLEDPPGHTVFFLLAESLAPILPTILSRVRLIRVAPLAIDVCARTLEQKGVEPRRAMQLAQAAEGSVGQALEMDGNEAYWQRREKALSALGMLTDANKVAQAAGILVGKDKDKTEAQAYLTIIEQLARLHMERGEGLDVQGAQNLPVPGDKLLKGVITARKMLASNVSWQFALEMLFMEAMEPGAVWKGSRK